MKAMAPTHLSSMISVRVLAGAYHSFTSVLRGLGKRIYRGQRELTQRMVAFYSNTMSESKLTA
jgi:hypothetical protein